MPAGLKVVSAVVYAIVYEKDGKSQIDINSQQHTWNSCCTKGNKPHGKTRSVLQKYPIGHCCV